jgi:hypothetical protein
MVKYVVLDVRTEFLNKSFGFRGLTTILYKLQLLFFYEDMPVWKK